MAEAELRLVFAKFNSEVSDISTQHLGRGVFLMVQCEKLTEEAFIHIRRLSFYYMVFEVTESGWFPVPMESQETFGDDLSIRLKYNGKTNEAFTRLLMNVALYSSAYAAVDHIALFDPICGKGTTLFEGLIQGYSVAGAEVSKTNVEDMYNYFLRYLKEGRYKHEVKTSKALADGKTVGELYEVTTAPDKERFKELKQPNVKIFRGDTTVSHKIFKKNSFHIICGDLPYGVQHKGKAGGESTRDLNKWMKESFSSWYELLKYNGALSLSWNTYTNSRAQLSNLLTEAGFTVSEDPLLMKFGHRVSQAINRDIIVASKIKSTNVETL